MTLKSEKKIFKINKGLWKGKNFGIYMIKQKHHLIGKSNYLHMQKKLNISAFSTPYDESALNLLESLNCPIYKKLHLLS